MTTYSNANMSEECQVVAGGTDLPNGSHASQEECIKERAMNSNQQVPISTTMSKNQARKLNEFYKGKTILLTGVTGFVGKVCLIKLMHSLKSCGKVYVMLRPKKGMTAQQRFNKLISEEPFTAPPNENPNGCPDWNSCAKKGITQQEREAIDWSKVTAIEGDMSLEDLGFEDEIKEKLCKNIDIVFNIAASVNFVAPLKQNLRDNYMGCRNLLKLATKLEKLISFVHVSTFYANSHMSHVEEKVIPLERDCEEAADLITKIPDSAVDKIAPDLMENRPNTYVYTKAMAENLVMKYNGILPIAIVRPSIVMPSVSEPYPGWIDNVNGPMGLGVLASLGILRNIDWNYYGVADLIPVDYVANSMLAVAERTPRLHPKEIKVYNCSSSSLKPVTWGETFEHLRATSMDCPPYKMLRMPIKVPRHKKVSKTSWFLSTTSELMFAFFIDFLLTIFGQKQILRKLTAKLHHAYEIMKPFTTTAYTCSNDNLLEAFNELDTEDKNDFCFQPEAIVWRDMLRHACYGIRTRLCREDPGNIAAAKRKMRVHQVFELVLKGLYYILIGYLLSKSFYYIAHRTQILV